ncbi:MAG: CBS domain-containing protein, partial [bacterium]
DYCEGVVMEARGNSISLLLVDNDPEFHSSARTLLKAGFRVRAVNGLQSAERELLREKPDLLILDIAAGGIQTLRVLRKNAPDLAAIILARHSTTPDHLKVASGGPIVFIAKPVNLDELVATIRHIVSEKAGDQGYREHTVCDLMVSADFYPRIYAHESVSKAVTVLAKGMFRGGEDDIRTRLRSALVFDRQSHFIGMIRLNDLLSYLEPPMATESGSVPYTGLFHVQCRHLMRQTIGEVMTKPVTVQADVPLMEAVHLMVIHHQINLPVLEGNELVGVIRDKDILMDVAGELGLLEDE